ITPQTRVQPQFWAKIENLAHLRLQNIAWKAVFRDTEMHHSARNRRRLENRDRVSEQCQIVCRRKSRRPRADDGNLLLMDHPRLFRKNVNWIPGFRTVTLGQKPLQRSNGNRQIEIAAPTRGFARMAANSAADRSKRIGDSRVSVRFLVSPLRD